MNLTSLNVNFNEFNKKWKTQTMEGSVGKIVVGKDWHRQSINWYCPDPN